MSVNLNKVIKISDNLVADIKAGKMSTLTIDHVRAYIREELRTNKHKFDERFECEILRRTLFKLGA